MASFRGGFAQGPHGGRTQKNGGKSEGLLFTSLAQAYFMFRPQKQKPKQRKLKSPRQPKKLPDWRPSY